MNEYTLHKKPGSVSWKVPTDNQDAFASFRLTHKQDTIHDALLQVTEGYVSESSGRVVAKEAWINLTPEDLDAIANAARIMATDIRAARRAKAAKPSPCDHQNYTTFGRPNYLHDVDRGPICVYCGEVVEL